MSETLLGRYRIERSLGRGAAAEVFRARDLELDRAVAVKVLSGQGPLADAGRLRDEARALARLDHPHILEILAIEGDGDRLFLVLELAEGGSLATRLARQGPYPLPDIQRLAGQVLEALAAAHGAGVVHRDVKPENVLLVDGRAKLADFGLAKHAESAVKTATGILLGTPAFMAPEAFQGSRPGPEADVYAAACLTYQLATGRPLFGGEMSAMMRAKISGPPRMEEAPAPLRRWLSQLLDPDPGRRPDAATAAATLTQELAGEEDRTVHLGAAPLAGVASARPRSPRAFPWLVLASPLLLLAGVWWMTRPPATPKRAVLPAPSPSGPPVREAVVEAEAEALALASEWEERFRDRYWGDILRDACRTAAGTSKVTFGLERAYVQELAVLRRQILPPPRVLKMERSLIESSRSQEAWTRDRPALLRLLGDRTVSSASRQRLAAALEPLAHGDAMLRAAGLEAHFGAAAVLAAHVPRSLQPWPDGPPAAAPLEREITLDVRRQVFAWEHPGDQRFPRIDPRNEEASIPEFTVLRDHAEQTGGDFDASRHLGVYRRILLDRQAAEAAWLELDLRVTNFFATNLLRLRLNDLRTIHHGGPELDPTGHWSYQDPTWWRLRLRVPGDYLRVGDNVLEITAEPLPGLGRWAGFWLDRVEVVAVGG